jgi:hypothetical protein
MCARFWSKYLKGIDHLEDVGLDWRIILKCILEKTDVSVWTAFIWLRIWTSGGDVLLGSIKCRKSVD